MKLFFDVFLFLFAFAFMEFAAWFTHKYIMHGFLWSLHKDHHIPGKKKLERNDLFGVFFAAVSILLIYFGFDGQDYRFALGLGIAAYGAAYFFVHDIFVHRRIRILKNTDNEYLAALRRAHKIHHKKLVKEDGESFGFLWVARKYYRKDYTG